MDGALSSDRYQGGGGGGSRYGPSGGGGGGYRDDRRGGRDDRRRSGGHRHHPYRRDDRGGGRHSGRRYGDDRYGGGGDRYGGGGGRGYRGGRGRGPRQPANRFSTEATSVDPQYAMRKQLTAMVAKMGDLGGAADVAASAASADNSDGADENGGLRPVVKAVGTNVSDLAAVLCGAANAPLFLKFGADAPAKAEENEENAAVEGAEATEGKSEETPAVTKIDAAQEAGSLATLLLHCASNLPLQTPSYAALTLGVDSKAPATHAGFARRCVELGMRALGRDVDGMLEGSASTASTDKSDGDEEGYKTEEERVAILKSKEDQRCLAETSGGWGNGGQVDAYHRAKLTLRYFAHLATIGVVSADGEADGEGSLIGLLESLAEAAARAARAAGHSNEERARALLRAARLLASLALSTVPYLLQIAGARPRLSDLVEALDNNVVGRSAGYVSEHDPAAGAKRILLPGELDDVAAGGMEEDDESDEEEEEEEEDEGPSPCADTLQDLLRTVRSLLSSEAEGGAGTRFALPDDAPWRALTREAPAEEGMDVEGAPETAPLTYDGEPLTLDLIGGEERRCRSLPYLLSLDADAGIEEGEPIDLRCRALDGMVFGRLAVFDAPPSPDEEEEEDEEEGAKEANPNLDAYVRTYSLADRCLLSDAVRDVLVCHRPLVSDAGADRNTAKETAEHVWAASHLVKPAAAGVSTAAAAPASEGGAEGAESTAKGPAPAASQGIEYGIVETLLSLIAQSTPPGASTPAAAPQTSHLYLSRVLLELTKLQPTLVGPAVVLAASGLFHDFLPSLTPAARENLAAWLAFHLANTGGQWPAACWAHWAPYASAIEDGGRNSRGEFLRSVLRRLAGGSRAGAVAVVECLPPGSALVPAVLLNQLPREEELAPAERDLIDRLWNAADDPDAVRQYVISDELAESYGASHSGAADHADNAMDDPRVWWRARLAARALFYPCKRVSARTATLTERAWKGRSAAEGAPGDDDGAMDEEGDESEDLLADVSDAVSRFKPVVLAALARDADAFDGLAAGRVDDDALLLAGEASILNEVGAAVPAWDVSLGNSLVECLLKTKIVSGTAVARWALGDDDKCSVRAQWWTYVSLALRRSIEGACARTEASRTDLGGGIGMIVDDTGQGAADPAEAAAARLDEALKAAVPVLKYVVERVCAIVASSDSGKKVPAAGADAVEGLKRLVDALLFHFRSCVVGEDGVLTAANMQKGFASMDADGEKLASMCRAAVDACQGEGGKKLLRGLALSLERTL
ncbi:hypothetical protein ACHAXT_001990 [Thalassiosira profunda]